MSAPLALPVQPFDQAWTLAETREWLRIQMGRPDSTTQSAAFEKWRDTQYGPHRDRLCMAIVGHLAYLAQTIGIELPAHAEAIDQGWLRAWRELHQTGTLGSPYLVASLGNLVMPALDFHQRAPTDTAEVIHEAVVASIINGDFDAFEMRTHACQATGEELMVAFRHWHPVIGRYPGPKEEFQGIVAGEYPVLGLDQYTLPLPTGRLCISTLDRLGPIHERIQAWEPHITRDSSQHGRHRRTQRALEAWGIACLPISDTAAAVVMDGDTLRLGGLDYDAEIGCQDRTLREFGLNDRWAVLADRSMLEKVLSMDMSPLDARAQVNAWIGADEDPIVEQSLPAGNYQLYCSASPEVFSACFRMEEVDMSDFDRPVAVVHPVALTPKLAPRSVKP